jgi:hypothetical protein
LLQAAEHQSPVVGYRWWLVVGRPDRAQVMSLFFNRDDEAWIPGSWRQALCLCHARYMPVWSCRAWADPALAAAIAQCGFYALVSPDRLLDPDELENIPPALDTPKMLGLVCGTVELAGRVVAHEEGFRAEYARLVGLFGPEPGRVWLFQPDVSFVDVQPIQGLRRWLRRLRGLPEEETVFRVESRLTLTAVPAEGMPIVPWPDMPREIRRVAEEAEREWRNLRVRVETEAPYPCLRIVCDEGACP